MLRCCCHTAVLGGIQIRGFDGLPTAVLSGIQNTGLLTAAQVRHLCSQVVAQPPSWAEYKYGASTSGLPPSWAVYKYGIPQLAEKDPPHGEEDLPGSEFAELA